MTELKPCPFDEGQGLHAAKVRDNGRDGCGPPDTWWVQCKCGAEGPNARDPKAAREFWNTRPLPAAGADPEVVRPFLERLLAEIESEPQCCGRGVAVDRGDHQEEECCGLPEYGFDRAAGMIRALLADATDEMPPARRAEGEQPSTSYVRTEK